SANISATAIPTLWYPLAVVRMAAVLASVVNKRPPLIMLVALGNIGGGAAHPGLGVGAAGQCEHLTTAGNYSQL
ncbi:MAG: hypothetical protein QOH45_229, partial [Pseudonocardiales bacterium]|nr:hypothetical protein [Pseudonocardiales bacterium]